MRTLLLVASFPIPPSVNNRTEITRRGGHDKPATKQFKQDATYTLLSDEALKYNAAIVKAREYGDFLSVTMWFYLPLAEKPHKRGPYLLSRDLDNMSQLPNNVLKTYLGIDDVMMIDLDIHKRLLVPPETTAYVRVSVSSIDREAILNDESTPILPTPSATTTNSIQTSINKALTTIESVMASSTSGNARLATEPDA